MSAAEIRVLIEAVAAAQDDLVRRLLLNVLMAEMERLRRASEPGPRLHVVRGEHGT